MKVLVCGGRDYDDYSTVKHVLDHVHSRREIKILIHGAARGADLLGERWAKENEIEYRGYPAKWKKQRNAAGPIRNRRMLDEECPNMVVAFPGGTGTADMIEAAKAAGVAVLDHHKERVR